MGRKEKMLPSIKIQVVEDYLNGRISIIKKAVELGVSDTSIRRLVKKYSENGFNALVDRRGKNKSFEELSESEKLSAQLKLLEAENRRLKMENDFLKKLEEIERR